MKSNFANDIINENIIHKIIFDNGFEGILKSYGFSLINKKTTQKQQDDGIDLICLGKDGIEYNFDEKCRFTIPLYNNHITGTFSLEIANTSSNKRGWFIDSLKKTDFYILLYPILSGKLKKNENYNYIINEDFSIKDSNIFLKGIMGQVISVKKIRNRVLKNINLEKLGLFAKSFNHNSGKYEKGINYFDINFNKIGDTKGKKIYFTFSNSERIPEKPLNIIVKQEIYDEISEFKFHINLDFVN